MGCSVQHKSTYVNVIVDVHQCYPPSPSVSADKYSNQSKSAGFVHFWPLPVAYTPANPPIFSEAGYLTYPSIFLLFAPNYFNDCIEGRFWFTVTVKQHRIVGSSTYRHIAAP